MPVLQIPRLWNAPHSLVPVSPTAASTTSEVRGGDRGQAQHSHLCTTGWCTVTTVTQFQLENTSRVTSISMPWHLKTSTSTCSHLRRKRMDITAVRHSRMCIILVSIRWQSIMVTPEGYEGYAKEHGVHPHLQTGKHSS